MKQPKIDFDGIWMSVRYCLPRKSITSINRANDIVQRFHKYLSDDNKISLSEDIEDNSKWESEVHDNWYKLMKAFNPKWHTKLVLTSGETKTCFEHKGRYYVLETYLKDPHKEITLNEEYIVNEHE